MIGRIKTERLSDRVSEIIIKLIREENFKPGDKFHSENTLVQRLGVSRSSIREAMRSLESTGWVTVRQGKGVFVNAMGEKAEGGFAGWLKSNSEAMREHFEVRLMLDPKAAAYAARNATADDIDGLKYICEEFKSRLVPMDIDALILVDEKFHSTIARCTRNETLYVLMRTMARSLPVGWISSLQVPGRAEKTIEEHCAVVSAIERHDPEAAEKAMIAHLHNAMKEISEFLEKPE
jgi:GntR family transcriptional repressor for pyruvate dehydrogenase complex